jgi:hypothetical protein
MMAMMDRNRQEKENSVRHHGHDGQKMDAEAEKMSVIRVMTDRKWMRKQKTVRHQVHDGQKWIRK